MVLEHHRLCEPAASRAHPDPMPPLGVVDRYRDRGATRSAARSPSACQGDAMLQGEPGLDGGRCLRPRLLTRRHGAASLDRSIRLDHEERARAMATVRRGRIGISSGRRRGLHLLSPRERPAKGRARRPDRRGRGNPPSPTRSCWPRDSGSSDRCVEAGRMEHVVYPAKRAERAGLRGQEGGGGLDLIRDRRAPGPGSEPPVERPGRNGRCFRLPGAPGPRAGARPSRHGERIGWAAQVAHQGLDQRGEMPPIVPGSDEMRATRLRDRRRK